jgi:hypothetical protein
VTAVEISQQVMSLLPLDPLLPGALPPDRRAALELRMAQLRTAPPIQSESASRSDTFVTLSPVSTETGEGQMSRNEYLLRASPACIAGVRTSRPKRSDECGRMKL